MVLIEIQTEPTPPPSPEVDEAELSCDSNDEFPTLTSAAQRDAQKTRLKEAAFASYLRKNDDDDDHAKVRKLAVEHKKKDEESRKIIDQARDYQEELFELAKVSNVIAVLDTGSGKTLISCLLMRWMAQQEMVDRASGKAPRVAFFLANSHQLVKQQHRVVSANLPNRPAILHGGLKFDNSRQGWQKLIVDHSAIVCTSEILNQSLAMSFVTISQVSLLVFDEAHNAKKEHPMARIIIDYCLPIDAKLRPKIFGMTASPLNTKGDVSKAIEALEEFLDSKIVTTPDMTLLAHAPRARNVEWSYDRLRLPFETELYQKVSLSCSVIEELRVYFTLAKSAASELGPWVSDQIWLFTLGTDLEVGKIRQRHERSKGYQNLNGAQRDQQIQWIKDGSKLVKNHLFRPPRASLEDLSSKSLLLFKSLSSIYSGQPGTRCIIFVERRLTAQILASCFERLRIPNLRVGVLLGVNASGPVIDKLETSAKKQDMTMDRFRAGLINCIFATSVAEEGIDVPQCNMVIRFDLFKSPIQYMQSRGRARMKDSIYAMMVEHGNRDHRDQIDYCVEMEEYIKEYCRQLPPDRLLGTSSSILAKIRAKEAGKVSFQIKATGAVCNYGNCRVILSGYVGSLRYVTSDAAMVEPAYELHIKNSNLENQFRYRVFLLEAPKKLSAWGFPCRKKQLAKSSAAFQLCRLLRVKGELDDNLKSIHVRIRPENANARIAVSEKKHKYAMRTKPDFWNYGVGSTPVSLYATLLCLLPSQTLNRRHAPLVIMTRQPLPSIPAFKVYLGPENISTDVVFKTFKESLQINQDDLELLSKFTLDGIFADVFNKKYTRNSAQMSYWLAPSLINGTEATDPIQLNNLSLRDVLIDLPNLQAAGKARMVWTPGDSATSWCNKFLVDPRNGKYHYFTDDIVEGATMDSPIPETAKDVPNKHKASVIEWTDSLWKKSKQILKSTRDPSQPVLSADLITTRRNFLDPWKEKATSVSCHVCPQPLEASSLEPAHAATALVWPAILHRLESYLITSEGFAKIGIQVPAELSLEAFTKDSNTEDSENQIHSGLQRGMGKNYERLEFIGDSLLKMTTTIMVYIKHPFDEFSLHCKRMAMLSNRNLCRVAVDSSLELFQYTRSSGFNRDTWYPENLVLEKGRGVKAVPEPVKHPDMTHDLGQKTIADVSEAIIGAALIASQNLPSSTRFDLAITAVTRLVDAPDHDILNWSDISPIYIPPPWSLLQDDPVANDLAARVHVRTGYRFKNPRLFRSAMTHSSDQLSTVPDMQRLEFLGDAILDMVCINWMFEKHPDRNPQWLTEHKMAMVSNKFLAALAIDLGFDKFLQCSTTNVVGAVEKYAHKVRDVLENGKQNIREDFWVDITAPPKCLSDQVESYIGAVLIDSNFNYSQIEKFFEQHILWYFKNIEMYDTYANRHPTSFFHRKLTTDYGCTDFKILCSEPTPGDTEEQTITAGIVIHNKVAASNTGTSSKYAKVRVSKECLEKLNGMTIEQFREEYECDCRRGGEGGELAEDEELGELDATN